MRRKIRNNLVRCDALGDSLADRIPCYTSGNHVGIARAELGEER